VRALLLAAGLGTRLRPLTERIPKCLMPIQSQPLLAYWLELLLNGGIERALVNTHHLPGPVRAFVAGSPWRDRVDLAHEEQLLGTGGTVSHNRDYFLEQPFLVAHADNLTDFDVQAMMARHARRPPGAVITMMTFETDDPCSCGIVEADDNGLVVRLHEKVTNPPGTRANGAVYVFEPAVLDYLAALERKVIDLSTEVLPAFLGRIFTFYNRGYHRDIGTPESLARAEREFGCGVPRLAVKKGAR